MVGRATSQHHNRNQGTISLKRSPNRERHIDEDKMCARLTTFYLLLLTICCATRFVAGGLLPPTRSFPRAQRADR